MSVLRRVERSFRALAAPALLLALLVGMALFRFGWIGGGDAKFYAAMAAWFPLRSSLQLLLAVSLAGLAVVLLWFVYRRATHVRPGAKNDSFAMVPYGVAVAVGAIAARMLI